jgi:DNA-binding transcriptional ArsR family regulator
MNVYEALADPHRRRIIELVGERERTAGAIVGALGISQPGASQHLKALRDAGLVAVRKDAQRRFYSLRPEKLAEVDAWLAPYRRFWIEKIDALVDHIMGEQ